MFVNSSFGNAFKFNETSFYHFFLDKKPPTLIKGSLTIQQSGESYFINFIKSNDSIIIGIVVGIVGLVLIAAVIVVVMMIKKKKIVITMNKASDFKKGAIINDIGLESNK